MRKVGEVGFLVPCCRGGMPANGNRVRYMTSYVWMPILEDALRSLDSSPPSPTSTSLRRSLHIPLWARRPSSLSSISISSQNKKWDGGTEYVDHPDKKFGFQ